MSDLSVLFGGGIFIKKLLLILFTEAKFGENSLSVGHIYVYCATKIFTLFKRDIALRLSKMLTKQLRDENFLLQESDGASHGNRSPTVAAKILFYLHWRILSVRFAGHHHVVRGVD
jgi:hypothetical protein